MLWQRHGDEILKGWIRKRPGTRPICWWWFSSGLERKCHPDYPAMLLTLDDSIPEDQFAWLAERSLLEPSEDIFDSLTLCP